MDRLKLFSIAMIGGSMFAAACAALIANQDDIQAIDCVDRIMPDLAKLPEALDAVDA